MKKILRFARRNWVEILLLSTILGIHIYVAFAGAHYFPSRWFTRDDAYYYFKVAQNISEGYGSTFDGINLTNGYHPLWLLICVPIFSLARFDLILPLRILLVIMGVLSAVTSVMMYRLLKKHLHPAIGFLIAALWGYGRNVHEIVYQQGMETGITALAIVGFLMTIEKISTKKEISFKKGMEFGIWGLVLLLSRLDTMFLVLFGLVWVVFRGTRIQTRLIAEILLVYISVILAFVARVGLDLFLLAYDTTAILYAAVIIVVLFVTNFLLGNYNEEPLILRKELLRVALAIVISGFVGALFVLPIAWLTKTSFSLSVPLVFIPIMMGLSIGFRLALRHPIMPTLGMPSIATGFTELKAKLVGWLQDALKIGWIIGVGFGVYAIINKYIFGTFMPVSGQIKRWWGSSPDNVYGGSTQTIQQMFGIDPAYSKDGWTFLNSTLLFYAQKIAKWTLKNRSYVRETFGVKPLERADVFFALLVILIATAIVLFLVNRRRNERRIRNMGLYLLFFGSLFHILFYGATGYASKHEWYWVSEDIWVFLALGWAIQAFFDLFRKIKFSYVVIWGFSLWFAWGAFVGYQRELIERMPMVDLPPDTPYIDMAAIMEEHTPPGSIIGMTGGGNVGYFIQDRTIMNMDGLINSAAYFEALQAHGAKEFYLAVGLDYIFANRYILTQTAPYSFQIKTEDLQQVEDAPTYGNKKLLIYAPKVKK